MKTVSKPESFNHIFTRKGGSEPTATHYCPGCGHGVIHKLLAEVIDELGIRDRTILISPVGCSVFAYYYFDVGNIQVAHGRCPAVATAVKRALPESLVVGYQGDGDLAAIGGNEILQAANRGENITVVFVNNAVFGMTGGQMAPTTLPGMVTTSSPIGRDVESMGFPIRMAEILSNMDGAGYIVRRSLHNPANIRKSKKAIRLAFETQQRGLGFSMVELLSSCPTNWKVTPNEALTFIEDNMIPTFPLGDYKVNDEIAKLRV